MQQRRSYVELARKAIKGDRSAFEDIIREKQRRFLFSAMSILKNESDAEDAVQDAILKMYRNIGKLKSPMAVSSWMDTIVRNECYRIYGAARPQMNLVDLDDEDGDVALVEEDREFLPETYAVDKDLNEKLYETVLMLSPAKREAILMYYYQGLSYNEMAEMTGTTASSVSVNLSRARVELKKILLHEGGLLGDVKMEAMVSIPAVQTVMGRALEARSVSLLPDEKLAGFEQKWTSALHNQPVRARHTSRIKSVIIVVVAAVVFSGATFGISLLGDDDERNIAAQLGREIVFVSDAAEFGNINPTSIKLGNLVDGDSVESFTIKDASGSILFRGDAEDAVKTEILKMERANEAGDYVLSCELKDKDGNQVLLEREFTIGSD